jgi:hypothetical protein
MHLEHPINQRYYKHVDGGLYFVLQIAKSTVDLSEHVVYVHVFPFDLATWIRPLDEWTPSRFTLIDHAEAEQLLKLDRNQLQQEISRHKATRRAAEGR